MRIGTFVAVDGGGFGGHMLTLFHDIELALLPTEKSDSDNAPDFRVIAGSEDEAREIGAAWKHVGEKAGDYLTIQIDDPMFAQPMRANLFKDNDGGHTLIWNRLTKRDEKP